MEITVVSLCDGISTGQFSLTQAGFQIKNYYASEIDKYAIQIANKNFPNTIQLGDMENWKTWPINWADVDLLIGGTPCQGFSVAGTGLNFNDPRSRLFFVYAEILEHARLFNPNIKFLLENVNMASDYKKMINNILGTEYVMLNSSTVSAQLCSRAYWFNWNADAPVDRNILLQDIIENGYVDREKSLCLTASYYKGVRLKDYEKKKRQLVFTNPEMTEYRKLTPLECERLQTLPDGYTDGLGISAMQRYKALGNGWTAALLTELFGGLLKQITGPGTKQTNEHTRSSDGGNDECYTPRFAVEHLLEYLEKFRGQIIWCPFDTDDSEFVKVLRENGFTVVLSHVKSGQNFFNYEPEKWDLIVSNPPFTDKASTFERCLQLGKPFALLMTILWLNDKKPVELFMQYKKDMQLLMFDDRMRFENQLQDKKISFKAVYFCTDFLPQGIVLKKLFENKNQLSLNLQY